MKQRTLLQIVQWEARMNSLYKQIYVRGNHVFPYAIMGRRIMMIGEAFHDALNEMDVCTTSMVTYPARKVIYQQISTKKCFILNDDGSRKYLTKKTKYAYFKDDYPSESPLDLEPYYTPEKTPFLFGKRWMENQK